MPLPLSYGPVGLRPIRVRDWRDLQAVTAANRSWLAPWEASLPSPGVPVDIRGGIRILLSQMRQGLGIPLVMEFEGRLVGQLNVSSIQRGSISSAMVGYWIAQEFAGRSITPTAVALATDYMFRECGLHRVEICIRPENAASLRVVDKLGFRFEGAHRGFLHIAGRWANHYEFALLSTDVAGGVLRRYVEGRVPADACVIPDWAASLL